MPKLVGVAFAHAAVDLFSFVIIPLLTVLEGRLSLSPTEGAFLVAIGSIASGVVQPLTAFLGDRHDTRWIGVAGFVLCVVAASLVGQAHNYWQILGLQVLASMGSGAFHPPAAAVMGHLSGRKRGLGMGVFFAAGMLGGIGGNTLTPAWAKAISVESLAWWMIPGLVLAAIGGYVMLSSPQRHPGAHAHHASKSAHERRASWRGIGVLYAGNAIRFTVNSMLFLLLVRWSEHQALLEAHATVMDKAIRANASTINGPMQAAMQIGMGIAGLSLGALIKPRHERLVLTLAPMIGALTIVAFPHVPHAAAFTLAILAGSAFAGVIPLTLSLAQRLLPHRTGLASGLMMGGAWSLAAIGPPLAQKLLDLLGQGPAFAISGGMLAISGLLALGLPRPQSMN
jgi:MFS transporter, FSR family, fosmidomycin resistance protein